MTKECLFSATFIIIEKLLKNIYLKIQILISEQFFLRTLMFFTCQKKTRKTKIKLGKPPYKSFINKLP